LYKNMNNKAPFKRNIWHGNHDNRLFGKMDRMAIEG